MTKTVCLLRTTIATIGLCAALPAHAESHTVALDFALPAYQAQPTAGDRFQASGDRFQVIGNKFQVSGDQLSQPRFGTSQPDLDPLFAGGSESLVARAVGTAEGTRTPTGDHTPAYYGHVDPGNGVWNLGSFSYQHGATSPEAADLKQLTRLRSQATQIQQHATTQGITLSLEETLNGIDLANQAPRAALAEDAGNYVDRLQQAYQIGLRGADAVLWARTYAYADPQTAKWDAPGLGNDPTRITEDQARRHQAIAKAISVYQQSQIARKPEPPPTESLPQPERVAASPPPPATIPPSTLYSSPTTLYSSAPVEILVPGELDRQTEIANQIIFQDLPNPK